MNIILAEPHEINNQRLILTDHRAEHIVKVLHSDAGDRMRIGLIDGKMGTGTVLSIKRKYPFYIELLVDLQQNSKDKPTLDLILALPRPIMLKRILSQVAALGVGTIHLINANRVEKSFWESGLLEPEQYRIHLLHGLEQAVDTRVPEVKTHQRFKPFIEDFFPSVSGDYHLSLLAHPDGGQRLGEVVDTNSGRIALAVGPEGGWVDYEVMKFQEQGFCCCTMGDRILKVDTAVVALHSRISALIEVRETSGK